MSNQDEDWQILGLTQQATMDDVKRAYRELAKQFHPDKNTNAEAHNQFVRIQNAYSNIVGQIPQQHPCPNHNLFVPAPELFFQAMHHQMHQYFSPPRRTTIRLDCEFTLEEFYHGATRTLELTKNLRDPSGVLFPIDMLLDVELPAGCSSGHELVFEEAGDESAVGVATDIIVVCVQREEHARFRRHYNDLIYPVVITLGDALTGFILNIDHLSGRTLTVVIDEIIQNGSSKRIVGEGFPLYDSEGFGDLVIEFSVLFPQRLLLTDEQKLLLRNLVIES